MKFLDRKEEMAELRRVLNPATPPKFVVMYGRRRLGKSTLIKHVISPNDIYYMAGDLVDNVQMTMLKESLAQKFPEMALVEFTGWEEMLLMLNRFTTSQFTLCLDEFPYMVKYSPELPSILQRLLDSKVLKFNIVICGNSQRMMHDMILSHSEPLFGRADAILNILPIPLPYLQQGLGLDAIATVEEYSVWGGVPRYWELREEYPTLFDAIKGMLLGPTAILYDEPKRLFLDDMKVTVQSESLMAVIASGASRLSEIASRMGRDATSLSLPLYRLIQMSYIRREIPFGESIKKSKRGIYRINDPMIDFYYTFILPNISSLARGRKSIVMEQISQQFQSYVSMHWEHLCREAVSGNMLFGHRWGEASRWWGNVPNGARGQYQEMEFDVVAASTDGSAILVGECKWSNPEIAAVLHDRLIEKARKLPCAQDKDIIAVLFLKSMPKDAPASCHVLYPQDVINYIHPE